MRDYIDIYCERLAPGLWAEPLNLVSNLAFILAAIYVWPRVKHDIAGQMLAACLFLIGIGSGAFHASAEKWAAAADSLAILLFIVVGVFFLTRRLIRWPGPVGLIGVLLFFPIAAYASIWIEDFAGPLNGSVPYVAVLGILVLFSVIASFRFLNVGRGLLAVAVILGVSVTFRSVDQSACAALPLGTHYMWHILNACLLAGATLVISRIPKY